MDDHISKDRLMEALGISDECVDCQHRLGGLCLWKPNMADVCEVITEMPSAEPERKKGKWNTDKESPEYATCSVCGHCDWDCTESEYFNYCPNCGADMRGGGE